MGRCQARRPALVSEAMASDSVTPPVPTGNGNAKYIVVLLLVLAGGLGAYLAMSGGEKTVAPPATTPEPPKNPEPTTSLSDTELVVPVDEPVDVDAGAPEPETKKHVRTAPAGDPWSCEGDIPTGSVRSVVADTQSAMRSCYERRLRNDNQLQGSINLQVRVGRDGKVDNTRVRGSMRDAEVLKCVQGMARSWSFPSPTGGNCAVLDVPYQFTPKN
jgi:outer membrane biosynthesis protein TonB